MTVYDASAICALLFREPGWETASTHLSGACASTVNLSEVLAVAHRRNLSPDEIVAVIQQMRITLVPVDVEQAVLAATLAPMTRHLGLSLGDRVCLALALQRGLPALTADRAWSGLEIGVAVRLIR